MLASVRNRALSKAFRKIQRGRQTNFQTTSEICNSLHSSKIMQVHSVYLYSTVSNNEGYVCNWGREFNTQSRLTASAESEVDNNIIKSFDGVHARADIKINILNEARSLANQSKALYQKSKRSSNSLSDDSIQNFHDHWKEKEVELSDAYSKAIKYTARLRKKDVAITGQRLLDDMIQRHATIKEESNFLSNHDGPQFLDRTVVDLVNAIEQEYSTSSAGTGAYSDSKSASTHEVHLTRDGIPLPTSKDFANVLHSWASSKVKRKGLHAESLLYRMMELAYFYPESFAMPDSRTFGLVVKCYAGSTFKDSLRRIKKLHNIHGKLAAINTPGIIKDDPFFLMHSIKGIQNYTAEHEIALIDDWFGRLHRSATDVSRNKDTGESIEVQDHASNEVIDLTGTYTSIMRGFSKVRKKVIAADKCWLVVQRMQELALLSETPGAIAKVDLKINALNLFLRSNTAHNDGQMLSKKLSLLDTLIESATENKHSPTPSLPLPNDQSFVSCIKALSTLKDPLKVTNEAERITAAYESLVKENIITASAKIHNSTIELYIDIFGREKSSILSICRGVSKRMEVLEPSFPGIAPDSSTFTLFLKACSIDDGNPETKTERFEEAVQIFRHLTDTTNNSSLNDKCFFYIMKCAANTISEPIEKRDKIIDLFSQACDGGFVSADVLKMLRTHTSREDFEEIAGNGRLAEKWITNVTSGLALYTDGTTGGAGKNARRKGKSTSNWSRKQNERIEAMQNRKQAKMENKLVKREREQNGKKRW